MAKMTPVSPATRPRKQLVTTAVYASGAVVLAGTAAQLINYAFDLEIDAFNSANDGGVFGAVGGAAAVSAAATSWLVSLRLEPRSPATVAAPPLLTFIALDKVFRIHDHVPHYLILYAPVLAGAFLSLAALSRRLPRPLARLLVTSLAFLALSFVLHVIGERLLSGLGLADAGWAHQVKAAVKHSAEVESWFLISIALGFTAIRGRGEPGVRRRGIALR
jgi:4-hydroxybenzoate polyprenyltransferase